MLGGSKDSVEAVEKRIICPLQSIEPTFPFVLEVAQLQKLGQG